MKRFVGALVFASLVAGCGGDDEKIPPRIDAAAIDGPSATDGPVVDAPEPDAAPDATVVDAVPLDAAFEINGCSAAAIVDRTAVGADRTVTFAGLTYTPACMRIAVGQSVTFSGSFAAHPLVGGSIVGGVRAPDATSPITSTSSGSSAAFTFATAGAYPYYCDVHGPGGMTGVVFVQ